MHLPHLNLSEKKQLMRLATYASVGVAVLLITVKFIAWFFSGSLSLQATLIDSVLDAAASFVNLLAVKHSLEPPDAEHRFGHGKLEAIAALGQSLFITASAAWLVYEAGTRLYHPVPLQKTSLGIGVMLLSIACTFLLIKFQKYVVSRTNSAAIKADSIHYQSDLIINLGVIFSLAASALLGLHWVDPIIGAVIALYILYTAWMIVVEAFNILMDHELSHEVRQKIKEITLSSHPDIRGMHDLRTRSSGIQNFIQLHLELDPAMPLQKCHEIAEKVEANLHKVFPHAEILIHQDPEGIKEKRDNFTRNPLTSS